MSRALVAHVLAMAVVVAGCGGGGSSPPGAPTGGSAPPTGGATATGGTAGSPSDSGGSGPVADAATSAPEDAATAPPTPGFDGGSTTPPAAGAYGGVGETPFVPVTYTATPVGPDVAAECPEDLTAGFTEYPGAFRVQRPYDLAASDRFEYKDGIYTFWVNSNDKAHAPGNGTAPRTEARYIDISSGINIWSADVMYEHVDGTCIMQIHNEVGNYATYLRITGDMMFDLKTRKTVIEGYVNKWFNMKVYFDTDSLDVKIYINNCLKFSAKSPKGPTPNWYFKHGVYTCGSGTCKSHYKNIHVYEKGAKSIPPLNMP
jgi:hypothetical protein